MEGRREEEGMAEAPISVHTSHTEVCLDDSLCHNRDKQLYPREYTKIRIRKLIFNTEL